MLKFLINVNYQNVAKQLKEIKKQRDLIYDIIKKKIKLMLAARKRS